MAWYRQWLSIKMAKYKKRLGKANGLALASGLRAGCKNGLV